MKKSLRTAAICFSVFAPLAMADVGSGDPTLLNIPQNSGGFFIGGTAFYLQPNASNDDLSLCNSDES